MMVSYSIGVQPGQRSLASARVVGRSIQVTIAVRSCWRVVQVRLSRALFCNKPKNDSMAALSPASLTATFFAGEALTSALIRDWRVTFRAYAWAPAIGSSRRPRVASFSRCLPGRRRRPGPPRWPD